MLRDDQIDLRRERARAERYAVERLGKNRVFADYRVTNPATGGRYTVTIRGFDLGDNACTCPDFKANTLGTCKHIEAVLEELRTEQPERVRKRKAAVTRPELFVHYGPELRLGIAAPARRSDPLEQISRRYFDADGLWNGEYGYESLLAALDAVPELVDIPPEVFALIDADVERRELREKEADWLWHLDRGELPPEFQNLVKAELLPDQWRGVAFLASRPRSILGDGPERGDRAEAIATAELLARQRGIGRVLIVAPEAEIPKWSAEIERLTGRACAQFGAGESFYCTVDSEKLAAELERINAFRFDLIVLDGAEGIGNWQSPTAQATKRLRSKYALALASTPVEENPDELFGICQFVDERVLGPAFQFFDEFREADAAGLPKGIKNRERLREKLAPIYLRRTPGDTKGDVEIEAPSSRPSIPTAAVDSMLDFLESLVTAGRELQLTATQTERLRLILEALNRN